MRFFFLFFSFFVISQKEGARIKNLQTLWDLQSLSPLTHLSIDFLKPLLTNTAVARIARGISHIRSSLIVILSVLRTRSDLLSSIIMDS